MPNIQLVHTSGSGMFFAEAATGYREGKESTFTHEGTEYSVDKVLALIERKKLRPELLPITGKTGLDWMLYANDKNGIPYKNTVDQKRVAASDTNAPVIVLNTKQYGRAVVDGFHRLNKAVFVERRSAIPGYLLDETDIASCKV